VTDLSLAADRFVEGDFRVGRVLNRTFSLLSRHFLTFFVVTAVAYVPTLLITQASAFADSRSLSAVALTLVASFLAVVLGMLSQAVVLYGAFQDMRRRPVSLAESLKVGLRRVMPVVAIGIIVVVLVSFGIILFVVPGLILFAKWSVAIPVCVVERLGPSASLARSSELTKGHRWKIFGLMLLLFIIGSVVSPALDEMVPLVGGTTLTVIVSLLWNGVWGAFSAIAVVVTYHDLRVAKEGVSIDEIAAVFD